MKKALCLVLCLLFVFTLCACGSKDKKGEDTVDIEYFVKNGKIPECEYALGVSANEITEKLDGASNTAQSDEEANFDEPLYTTMEKGNRTGIITDTISYFYDTKDKNKTVNYIVSYSGACGFNQGDMKQSITDTLKKGDLNAKPETLSAEETFFFPVTGEFEGIKYSFGENTLCFIFDSDQLCACALYKN